MTKTIYLPVRQLKHIIVASVFDSKSIVDGENI
jgi:hypothetical protein